MKSTNKWITVCHVFTSSTKEVRLLVFMFCYDVLMCNFFPATVMVVFVIPKLRIMSSITYVIVNRLTSLGEILYSVVHFYF